MLGFKQRRQRQRASSITDFCASNGWFRNWANRFNIGPSVRIFGEAGDVDIAEVEPKMEELRSELKRYKPKNSVNADETDIFYCTLPTRSYLGSEENRKLIRGSKGLRAKDRLTCYV